MGEFADNQLTDLKSPYDAKSLCEEFARIKGYRIRLVKEAFYEKWFVRLKYGDYNLKFFDGPHACSPDQAWEFFAEQLCDPDRWFNSHNFKGWSHFGKCSCPEELSMRMAIYGKTAYDNS